MGFGKQKPPERTGIEPWTHYKLEPGDKVEGWLGGDWIGLDTHHTGRTKPCRKGVTDGALKCSLCSAKLEKLWRAYVPFVDRNFDKWHVVVGRGAWKGLELILPGDAVVITKTKLHGNPIMVRKCNKRSPLTLEVNRFKPIDIIPWLGNLWKDFELADWMMKHKAAPADGSPVLVSDDKLEVRVSARGARAPRGGDGARGSGSLGDALELAMRRRGLAAEFGKRNGAH